MKFIVWHGSRANVLGAAGASCIIGLAACALQYAEPADDQAAELLVSTNAPLVMLFYRDAARCTDALQIPRSVTIGQTSYKVPTDKEFALSFNYIAGNMYAWTACKQNIISFHAKRGGVYVLHYQLSQGSCSWALNERSAELEAPVSLSKREPDPSMASMGGEGTWCKPKSL